MSRVLVTGGAGFIGSAIARRLVGRGDEVVVLDNMLNGDPARVPEGAELIEADFRDLEVVRKATAGADVVFHQGALRSVPRSVDDPVLATECNVIGTMNVLIAAQEAGVGRVVYASSSSAYGGSDGALQVEDATPNPLSPYAASKLAAEHYCRVWTRVHGLSTVSLRYFNVFGPGQDLESKYSAVFPSFVAALLNGKPPVVHWDGEQSRDFTYIDDVVDANIAAAEASERADGAVINIGGGHPRTINEMLKAISDEVGIWIEPERTPMRAGDIRASSADISRARDLLGWVPSTSWPDAVKKTIAYLRDKTAEPEV
jgi:nucleoside-diphosphate-sugar epimerase